MNRLEDIGFYTLSEKRAREASVASPLSRCELLVTGRCNFRCAYCRGTGGNDLPLDSALRTMRLWADDGLGAVRFSGGEPTLYAGLSPLVRAAKDWGIRRIAVSTNGSLPLNLYESLLNDGVNDYSISLDACCAQMGDRIAGVPGSWSRVVNNIRSLSTRAYTTVGVVLSKGNIASATSIVRFASGLGVADIRLIPIGNVPISLFNIPTEVLARHPVLRYRVRNLLAGRPVRGLCKTDPARCGLILDDMAVMGDWHFPCIIYLREGGPPIGKVGPHMRTERLAWYRSRDVRQDPICRVNCLDVCVDYNSAFDKYHHFED